jgi:hypothetical protein
LIGAKRAALSKERVYKRRFPVIDVRNNCYIPSQRVCYLSRFCVSEHLCSIGWGDEHSNRFTDCSTTASLRDADACRLSSRATEISGAKSSSIRHFTVDRRSYALYHR